MIIPSHVDFSEWIDFVGNQESQSIHPADYFDDSVKEMLEKSSTNGFDLLPWEKTHSKFALRPAELVLWCGYSGHKKSLLSGYVMMHLAKHNPVAIASMEMKPAVTLYRMACQAGHNKVPFEYYQRFSAWGHDRIVVYDQLDSTPGQRILGFVHYAAVSLGCKNILIDSLTKCGIAKDDGNSEKIFVDKLQWAAKTLNVTIHLVCHMRKPSDDKDPRMPNKYSIRGASEISDLADTVLIVHSNIRKKHVLDKAERGVDLSAGEYEVLEQPDQFLGVDKQRNGEWEGVWGLWHTDNQFLSANTTKRVEFDF